MIVDGVAAVVFDWAGTVVDFGSRAPAMSFVRLFEANGVEITEEQARESMGMPKRAHIEAIAAMPAVAALWRQRFGRDVAHGDVDRLYAEYVALNVDAVAEHADLVPGTIEVVHWLRSRGIRIGSNTGYGREIMRRLAPLAAERGFQPDNLVCADDLQQTRPSPMAMYRAFIELDVWPACRVVKVDDTVPGLLEGRHAGCWTVGVLASGNEVGLSWPAWNALSEDARASALQAARKALHEARPDYLIATVAELPGIIEQIEHRLAGGDRPPA